MSENIVIGDVRPRVQVLGDGTQTSFVYPFAIFKDSDLEVYLNEVLQTDGYLITGAGQSEGGNVIFNTAPSDGVRVTLRRYLKIERTSDFAEGGAFHAAVINQELDYLVALAQQNAEDINRSIKQDPTDGDAGLILPLKELRANAVLVFDENGSPIVGPSYDAIIAAKTDSDIAVQSAVQAQASAAAADADKIAAQAARDIALTASQEAQTAAQHTFSVYSFTATGGETSLSGVDDSGAVLAYVPGVIIVEMNGAILQDGVDFSATTGTSITGLSALSAGDVVNIRAFGAFNVTPEVNRVIAQGDTEIDRVQAQGDVEVAQLQIYTQQVADTVNNITSGEFFNMDGNGDLMPSLSPLHSEHYQLDSNGDIQPI